MQTVRRPEQIRRLTTQARRKGCTIGFVPTLGALHEGHLSLIRKAKAENDRVVVSIFVNPIQFNQTSDLKNYPKPLARDARLAAQAGADWLFLPSSKAIYPENFQTYVEVVELSRGFEGAHRPGHFKGVTTILSILFHLVQPTRAYFGQKDAQQARIAQQLARDLQFDLKIKVLPTVRERGGLAMSSRNTRLSSSQRKASTVLFEALQQARALIECDFRRTNEILRRIKAQIGKVKQLRLEYAAIVDAESLKPVARIGKNKPILILLAAWVGKTRLIDCEWIRP